MFTTRIISMVLVAAATVAGGTAPAAAATTQHSVQVRHDDLDLTSASDVARLHRRVVTAAREACGNYDLRDLNAKTRVDACRSDAIANAAPTVQMAIASASRGDRLASIAAH